MPHVLSRFALLCGAAVAMTGCAASPATAYLAATRPGVHSTAQSIATRNVSSPGLASTPAATATTTSRSHVTGRGSSTSTASPILLYAQDWNGPSAKRTMAQWQQVALTHAILVGSPGPSYGNMISQLHAWNPTLKVLVYDLGPFSIKGGTEFATLTAQHPDYFARDASGNLITVKAASGAGSFPNNYLMDAANPGWQAEEASRVLANIEKYGWDGAYVDSMDPGPLSGSTTGVPIDPSTGVAFTKPSWMQATGKILSVIKAAIGAKYLFSSGLVNGVEFTSFTHAITDSTANGGQTDSWLRLGNSSPTQYPSANLLASDLSMVLAINAQGKSFFGWTKLWMTSTQAQQSAWNTYALAAYLLVDNGVSDYYLFSTPSSSADRTTIYFQNELAALGTPTGAFTLTNGVYTRPFQSGVVTVNTTSNTASITVA